MFRPMRRGKQAIAQEACIQILTQAPRGVLAVMGEDDYPYAIPMNQLYREGKLYFHCAKEGHKLDALSANGKASFCAMDEGFRKEGDWALNIRSVVVFGTVRKMEYSQETVDIIRQLGLKHYPTLEGVEKEIQSAMERVQMLEMSIDHMTGKLVTES